MANPRGNENLGDLSFTPEEAAAIQQAEVGGRAVPPPAPIRRGRRGLGIAFLAVLALAGLAALFQEQMQPPAIPSPANKTVHHGTTVAIARKAVHFRREPSIASPSLGVIAVGTALIVEEQRSDGFDRVKFGLRSGYAAGVYLILASGVELVQQTDGRISDVSGFVRLREQPSLTAPIIGGLPAGMPITILGFTQSGWVLVTTQKQTGFLWGGLMDASPALPFQPKREGDNAVVVFGGRILRPS